MQATKRANKIFPRPFTILYSIRVTSVDFSWCQKTICYPDLLQEANASVFWIANLHESFPLSIHPRQFPVTTTTQKEGPLLCFLHVYLCRKRDVYWSFHLAQIKKKLSRNYVGTSETQNQPAAERQPSKSSNNTVATNKNPRKIGFTRFCYTLKKNSLRHFQLLPPLW